MHFVGTLKYPLLSDLHFILSIPWLRNTLYHLLLHITAVSDLPLVLVKFIFAHQQQACDNILAWSRRSFPFICGEWCEICLSCTDTRRCDNVLFSFLRREVLNYSLSYPPSRGSGTPVPRRSLYFRSPPTCSLFLMSLLEFISLAEVSQRRATWPRYRSNLNSFFVSL